MDKHIDDRRPFALVVDDDPLILMDASDMLSEAGFRPLEASNVDAAEAVLIEYAAEITLLFTDVQMPGGRDGFELARLTAERWPDIGILIASAVADPHPERMPKGAVFVRKPFSQDVIYDHLQALLPEGKKPKPLKAKTRAH
jgi:CheY-like chemotaxis protein